MKKPQGIAQLKNNGWKQVSKTEFEADGLQLRYDSFSFVVGLLNGKGASQYFHTVNMEAMPQALLHDRESYKQELLARGN